MAFSNPIGKGLKPERIDQGVDYGGAGPLYALGSGTVASVSNPGWPGGTFLAIHLDSGQYIYYAEDINPLVSIGQKVTAGQHIANATGGGSGIEIGWAAPPPNLGESMAMKAGQASGTGDPGSVSTAFGQLMSNLIASLGGPAGILQGKVSGSVPSSFGVTASGNTPNPPPSGGAGSLSIATSGSGVPGWVSDIPGIGWLVGTASDVSDIATALQDGVNMFALLFKPSLWFRVGAFFAGTILLAFGIYLLAKTIDPDLHLPSPPPVMPIPLPV